jgi:hypothetical protein
MRNTWKAAIWLLQVLGDKAGLLYIRGGEKAPEVTGFREPTPDSTVPDVDPEVHGHGQKIAPGHVVGAIAGEIESDNAVEDV